MDTLISLRRQTHAPVDVVIVTPPGPSNGTGWIPDEVGDEVRLVEHFGLEPGDPSSARAARLANLAATVVEGEWIAVVDAGDVLREDHLSHLLEVAIADRSEIVHAVVASVNGDGVSVEMAGDRQTRTGRLGPLLMHGEMRAFTLRPDAHLIAEQPSANRSARLRLIGVIESVAENVTATRPLAALTTATDHVVRPRDAESTAMSPSASGSVLGTRLHLGCGPNLLEGWVNIDLEEEYGPDLVHDLSMGLPFDDESVDLVHSEHFFEHLSLPDGYSLMQECHRVLRPGGRVRIAMPDLRSTVEAYLGDWRDQAWVDAFPQLDTAARMLNMGLREWGHQYVYDIEDLTLRLESLGFSAVVPQSWGRSEIVELDGLETRPDSLLIVEAIR